MFNLLGQRIATLVDEARPAGFHTATWHATDGSGRAVAAGVYIYRMTVGEERQTGRMVLIDGQAGIPAAGAAGPMPMQASALERVEADAGIYGLTVAGEGLVAYVNPAFRVGVDEVDIVVEEHSGRARMKLAAGGILGDVDNNERVDFFDALLVALYSGDSSVVMPNNGDISLGDVNADGRVDLTDALAHCGVSQRSVRLDPAVWDRRAGGCDYDHRFANVEAVLDGCTHGTRSSVPTSTVAASKTLSPPD